MYEESEIILEGLAYRNIGEVCRYHNIYDSLEEKFDDTYIKDIQSVKKIDEGVKDYIKSQCKIHNLNYKKILNKVKDECSIDDIIEYELEERQSLSDYLQKELTIFGETYTFEDVCKKYDKNYLQIDERLANGWTLEEAFIIKKSAKLDSRIIHLDGNIYTLSDACKKYKIPYYTISHRLCKFNLKEAFEIIPSEFPKLSNYDSMTYYRPLEDLKRDWTKYGYKEYYDELERLVKIQKSTIKEVEENGYLSLYSCKFGFDTISDINFHNSFYKCMRFKDKNKFCYRYANGCRYCSYFKPKQNAKEKVKVNGSRRLHISVYNYNYIQLFNWW